VTRLLKIRYIWIDSLCIIQGAEGWDREKGNMGKYYQYSLFTIAAA